jgi:MoxR-like ATPase
MGTGERSHMDASVASVSADKVAEGRERILAELRKVIVGQDDVVEQVLIALFTGGHCLITGVPGLAKTLLIKTLADILDLDFKRIQFTPDIMPSDITGTEILDEQEGTRRLRFVKGPIFAQIILADEINRTPPKTQAALLEAMQERQVTVEGETFPLEAPFHVLATANPVEYEGTYPLPEAQLDRFLLRVTFGYPTKDQEWDVLRRRVDRRQEAQLLDAVTDAAGLLDMQAAVETVRVEESVGRYCVALASATREHPQVMLGSSPRGALALMLTARAYAVIAGRDYVIPEDVKIVARSVLSHRVSIKPELWMSDVSGSSVVRSVLAQVPTPGAREAGFE